MPKAQDAGWGLGERRIYKRGMDVPLDLDRTLVAWYPEGSLLTFTPWAGCTRPKTVRGRRGEVQGFSRSSRRRLMTLTAALRTRAVRRAVFVTLTYAHDWSDDPEDWKDDLRKFCQRLVRRWPRASVVWRMEAQERGAPHFHLIVLGARFVPHEWVRGTWGKGRTEAKRVGAYRQAMAYVSKYVSKCADRGYATSTGQVVEHVGRVWGVVNRACLPQSRVMVYCVRGLAARGRLLSRLAWSTRWEQLRDWPLSGGGVVFGGQSDRVLATVLRAEMIVA